MFLHESFQKKKPPKQMEIPPALTIQKESWHRWNKQPGYILIITS
jgi:hypothetical protein